MGYARYCQRRASKMSDKGIDNLPQNDFYIVEMRELIHCRTSSMPFHNNIHITPRLVAAVGCAPFRAYIPPTAPRGGAMIGSPLRGL